MIREFTFPRTIKSCGCAELSKQTAEVTAYHHSVISIEWQAACPFSRRIKEITACWAIRQIYFGICFGSRKSLIYRYETNGKCAREHKYTLGPPNSFPGIKEGGLEVLAIRYGSHSSRTFVCLSFPKFPSLSLPLTISFEAKHLCFCCWKLSLNGISFLFVSDRQRISLAKDHSIRIAVRRTRRWVSALRRAQSHTHSRQKKNRQRRESLEWRRGAL